MSQISLFKSSTFRITLAYVLLFGISVLTILSFIYWNTIVYKTNKTDDDINAEMKSLTAIYVARGYPGLVTELSKRVQQSRPSDPSIYLLTDHHFRPLVGNITAWPTVSEGTVDDWINFKLGNDNARARTFEVVNRFNMLVGEDMKELASLTSLVRTALFWGMGLTLALALIGGAMMRQTLRSRLSAINQTSREIMQGDLRKRIKTQDSGDEFDELAINLNSMLDQIEHGMEGVRRVSDNIAHDLKTPLARLKNSVEELKFRVEGKQEEEAAVDKIIHEADGLLGTFNALLRIARIEYSEQRKEFSKVEMNSILYDLQELYEPLIEEKGQTLSMQIDAPIVLRADRDMLFQAFANLLDNAIKYTPPQGMIEIKSYVQAKRCFVEISDNGPGIPKEEYEKVVLRFYRLDQSRTTPGSGLGLSLVFAVLKLHQLDLNFADNSPGLKVIVSFEQSIKKRMKANA